MTETRTIVAATPGWHVALFLAGGEEGGERWDDHFSLEPIIAWEIVCERGKYHRLAGRGDDEFVHHTVIPLTISGNMEAHGNIWAIRDVNGKFDFVYDRVLDEAEALVYAKQLDDERLAERKASAKKPALAP